MPDVAGYMSFATVHDSKEADAVSNIADSNCN